MSVNFAPSQNEQLSALFNALIDGALEKENAAQQKRTYLGASRIGDPCERRLGYEYHGHEGEPFKGKTIRRFRLGHLHEDETARWMRLVGFELHTAGLDGNQYGFGIAPHPETGAPRFAGHTDGVLTAGPLQLPYPVVWEHKIANAKNWNGFVKHGVKQHHPVYFAQCIIYAAAFGLAGTLFTALNTDTSEIYPEFIPSNLAVDAQLRDKAARIIESRVPEDLSRVAQVSTDYRCKFCPHSLKCWESKPATQTVSRPSWMRG